MAFPKVDMLFGGWVVDGMTSGVTVDGAGPVIGAKEFVFAGVLVFAALFAALGG